MNIENQDRFPEKQPQAHSSVSMANFDETKYLPYLDGIDLTDAQKDQLLLTLWDIMRRFVELSVPSESWGQIFNVVVNPNKDDSTRVK